MLLPLAAWSLNYIFEEIGKIFAKNTVVVRAIQIISLLVVIGYPLFVSISFAVDPANAQIADADSKQYANSWAAGWGVKESVAFFQNQARNQKIYIATEGTYGLMPESLEMYLVQNKNFKIQGYWPIDTFPQNSSCRGSKDADILRFLPAATHSNPDRFSSEISFRS